MANYNSTIDSTMSPDEAFEYLADFRTAADWDPATTSSELLTGDPFVIGAKYKVVTKFAGREMELTYETVEIDRPNKVVLQSGNGSTELRDTMTFVKTPTGTDVTYDANIKPKGFAKILDPALTVIFKRIGDHAVESLGRKLKARPLS